MRIAIVADVHIGNHRLFGGKTDAGINARCGLTLTGLSNAYSVAAEEACGMMVIAGDLYDTEAPNPQIIAKVAEIIQRNSAHIETVIIKGNHDSNSPAPGDHALGPLATVARIVEYPARIADTLLLPFAPNATSWVAEAVAATPAPLVISHFGISNASTAEYLLASSVPIDTLRSIAAEHGVKLWLSGDWHSHAVYANSTFTAVQIGALVPTGFNNPGVQEYGSVIIVDTATMQWTRRVIPGPRFVYTKHPQLLDVPGFNPHTMTHLYVKLADPSPEREETLAAWRTAGTISDYVSATEARSEVDASGEAVADAMADLEVNDLGAALIPYVRAMSIAEADKPKVIEKCQTYLSRYL